jgi:hypothetical protein
MKITNESEYNDALNRIIIGANYLDNPLITPQDQEKGMKRYDELCEGIAKYHALCRANRTNHGQRAG